MPGTYLDLINWVVEIHSKRPMEQEYREENSRVRQGNIAPRMEADSHT